MASEKMIFFFLDFFQKLRFSVAMATNQIQRLDKIKKFGRLLKEYFFKTLVKISVVR